MTFTNNNLRRFLIVIAAACVFQSCNLIRLINTTESRDESKEEINEFLEKHRYNYDYSVCSVDSTYASFSNEKNNIYITTSDFITAIQLRVYEPSGNLYSAYSQCGGDFKKNRNITAVPPPLNQNPNINTALKLSDELDLLELSDIQRQEIIEKSKSHPYTFVVHWAIWTNYFSENVLQDISRLKKKYPKDVLVILVNVGNSRVGINGERS